MRLLLVPLILAAMAAAQTAPWNKALGYLEAAVDRYHTKFDVYSDFAAAGNNFNVRAAMGPNVPSLDDRPDGNCTGRTCLYSEFIASRGNWGGWAFLNGVQRPGQAPSANWGTEPNAGVNLTGATQLRFRARGTNGTERVKFIAFGANSGPYPDSAPRIEMEATLTTQWTDYSFSLAGLDLRYVLLGFGWTVDAAANGNRDVRFWVDEISYDLARPSAPRLAVSYEVLFGGHTFDDTHANAAFVYDNAAAIIALTAAGRLSKAKPLVDGLIYAANNDRTFGDGRLRAAYQGGELASPPGWMSARGSGKARLPGGYITGVWTESLSHLETRTGDMLWAMLALLSYHDRTAYPEALQTAKLLGNWIVTNVMTPDGLLGGVALTASDTVQQVYPWKSTEHNLDAVAAFTRLSAKDPDPRWNQALSSALTFLPTVWNAAEGRFAIGRPDTGVIPVDAQAWGVQVLGVNHPLRPARALDFAETRHKTGIGYGFRQNGLTSTCGDQPWLEGTAQMALSWLIAGRADLWTQLTANLRSAQQPSGSIPATTALCVDTNDGDRKYFNRQHLGATAWLALAEMGVNPYVASSSPGSCVVTLSPVSTSPALRQGGDVYVNVETAAGCVWELRSDSLWAQVFPLTGAGPLMVTVKLSPNFSSQPRTATIRSGGGSAAILQSAPFGLTPDERYIELLYFGFLGRLPSAAERAFQAAQPRTRLQRAVDFFNSDEFKLWGKFVAGAYVGLLNRDPEFSGWLFQRDLLSRTGGNGDRLLVTNILASQERLLTFGTPSRREFIRLLYLYILGRAASNAELDFQEQFGAPERDLAYNFLRSTEFADFTRARLLPFLVYATVLQRDMTVQERTAAQGKTLEELLQIVVPQVN